MVLLAPGKNVMHIPALFVTLKSILFLVPEHNQSLQLFQHGNARCIPLTGLRLHRLIITDTVLDLPDIRADILSLF